MNLDPLIPWALSGVSGVLGWFIRVLWQANKELAADLSRLRETLPTSYVQKEDYRRDIYEIKQLLRDISEKLDTKVDK